MYVLALHGSVAGLVIAGTAITVVPMSLAMVLIATFMFVAAQLAMSCASASGTIIACARAAFGAASVSVMAGSHR
jgi:hypothetical protein